jgi:hypothetical protein
MSVLLYLIVTYLFKEQNLITTKINNKLSKTKKICLEEEEILI